MSWKHFLPTRWDVGSVRLVVETRRTMHAMAFMTVVQFMAMAGGREGRGLGRAEGVGVCVGWGVWCERRMPSGLVPTPIRKRHSIFFVFSREIRARWNYCPTWAVYMWLGLTTAVPSNLFEVRSDDSQAVIIGDVCR